MSYFNPSFFFNGLIINNQPFRLQTNQVVEWSSEHYKVSVLADRVSIFLLPKTENAFSLGLIIEQVFSCSVKMFKYLSQHTDDEFFPLPSLVSFIYFTFPLKAPSQFYQHPQLDTFQGECTKFPTTACFMYISCQ